MHYKKDFWPSWEIYSMPPRHYKYQSEWEWRYRIIVEGFLLPQMPKHYSYKFMPESLLVNVSSVVIMFSCSKWSKLDIANIVFNTNKKSIVHGTLQLVWIPKGIYQWYMWPPLSVLNLKLKHSFLFLRRLALPILVSWVHALCSTGHVHL